MNPLLWWLPPMIATLVAIIWVARRARQEAARDDALSPPELDRMRRALDKPLPSSVDAGQERDD